MPFGCKTDLLRRRTLYGLRMQPLDLSQDFSVHPPAFAGYLGPSLR